MLCPGDASIAPTKKLLDVSGHPCPGTTLFFQKGAPTQKTWFYQLDHGRNLGKTNPLNDKDMEEFIALQASFAESEKSWSVDVSNLDQTTFDLSPKNPNAPEEAPLRAPEEILAEIAALDAESSELLGTIRGLL